jgi:thymidylate synthase ThyX
MLKRELPGSKFFIVDHLPPEDLAMLQALYSRSAESVEVNLKKVAEAGSGKFMASYYVGYNHKSIADCGSTTMFIEGVSTLTAKAVQDWPLYSGQETSTRYIDMSKQRIVDPVGSQRSGEILQMWMDFYRNNQDRAADSIRTRHPRREGEDQKKYDAAVKARTFDVMRGFLPAGICTQLSWHTNLRQASEHLHLLTCHPAQEIRDIAKTLWSMFAERYPDSSGVTAAVSAVVETPEQRRVREAWEVEMANFYTYPSFIGFPSKPSFSHNIAKPMLADYGKLFRSRPRGAVLPHFLTDLGQLSFAFFLDFGSFRDIQRHRNGVVRMPLLTLDHGFENWYLDQLDHELAQNARDLVAFLSGAIGTITDDPVARQYYIPLGFRVPCQVTWGLPSAVYVMDLRSGKTIHPTLRRVVHWMCDEFRKEFDGVPLHADTDPDDWSLRRGQQTIVERGPSTPV